MITRSDLVISRNSTPTGCSKTKEVIVNIVDKILAITKDEDYLQNSQKQAKVKEYEHQIDQIVYKLYGLTEEEIKIVEDFEKRQVS